MEQIVFGKIRVQLLSDVSFGSNTASETGEIYL